MLIRPASIGEPSGLDDGRHPHEQFRQACRSAATTLTRVMDAMAESNPTARDILRAHRVLLIDSMLAAEVESRISRGIGVYAALDETAAMLSSRFGQLADPVMRQRGADLRDVCEYIRRELADTAPASAIASGRIVFAADLSPAQVLQLAQNEPLAIVLEHGAETSHGAILIRALAVPAVIRVPGVLALVHDGDRVLVDGGLGQVRVRSDPEVSWPLTAASPACESDPQPAVTRDGVSIAVTATIGDSADARRAMAAGADGIGLFRTEMLFLRGDQIPSEDAQEALYREVGSAVGSHRLTVRVFDLGSDKPLAALRLPQEPNPALGVRGVRLLFAHPELLRSQVRALLRAGSGARVRLLVPMVTDATDLARVRDIIDGIRRGNTSDVPQLDIGVMVETPAAALMAEELAAGADFMSIGTNDLAQYVLAADRESANMASFYDPMHPAVLRLVRGVAATAVRRGIPVSVCGEAAADAHAIPIFVGMGVTELSVRPSAVVRVKAQIRHMTQASARALAEEAVTLPTAIAVKALMDRAAPKESTDVRETSRPR
jgi:phosphoenolpyruvate-protein phosphotransferase